jgi:hypothetical protein
LTAVHPTEVQSFQPSSATWSDIVRQIEYQFVHMIAQKAVDDLHPIRKRRRADLGDFWLKA